MKKAKFDEHVEFAKTGVERVRQAFDDPNDDWTPVLIAVRDDGAAIIAGLFVDKSQWPSVIRAIVKKERAVFGAAVLSSWTLDAGTFEDVEAWYASGKSLRDHPDRKEIVLLDCAADGFHETWNAPIIRHPDQPPTLGEWKALVGSAAGAMHHVVTGAFKQPRDPMVDSGPH